MGRQQQAVEEMHARDWEAEAERQRLHAEVERLRISNSIDNSADVSAVQDGVAASTSKLEHALRALDDKVTLGGTCALHAAWPLGREVNGARKRNGSVGG